LDKQKHGIHRLQSANLKKKKKRLRQKLLMPRQQNHGNHRERKSFLIVIKQKSFDLMLKLRSYVWWGP
jgi:hypothetical protein